MSVKVIKHKIVDADLPVMIINLANRSIISIPTQIGCPVKCSFCLSSKAVFKRNLNHQEMLDLIYAGLDHIDHKNAMISFTGEGEPFLNLQNVNQVMEETHTITRISHFRLCSSGVNPSRFLKVQRFSKPVHLQLSLHSPRDNIRQSLIPATRPIKEILLALHEAKGHFDEIAINYVLMKDINDSSCDAKRLGEIISPEWIIKFNPLLDDGIYKKSEKVAEFVSYLNKAGLNTISYSQVGSSINNGLYHHLSYSS